MRVWECTKAIFLHLKIILLSCSARGTHCTKENPWSPPSCCSSSCAACRAFPSRNEWDPHGPVWDWALCAKPRCVNPSMKVPFDQDGFFSWWGFTGAGTGSSSWHWGSALDVAVPAVKTAGDHCSATKKVFALLKKEGNGSRAGAPKYLHMRHCGHLQGDNLPSPDAAHALKVPASFIHLPFPQLLPGFISWDANLGPEPTPNSPNKP